MKRALVVFHDHGSHWLSWVLKPGFRHVFAVVDSGEHWIMVDPRDGVPIIEAVADASFDLAAFYREEGYAVLDVVPPGQGPWGPFFISNCVGAVKAVLGLRAPFVFTPYQLYRRLKC